MILIPKIFSHNNSQALYKDPIRSLHHLRKNTLTRIGILSCVSEVLLRQPLPLLVILRNIDPLNLEDDRPLLSLFPGIFEPVITAIVAFRHRFRPCILHPAEASHVFLVHTADHLHSLRCSEGFCLII